MKQLQNVINCHRLFCSCIMEVDLDLDFKFAPSGLAYLVRRFRDDPIAIGVTVMKTKLYFLHVSA